MTAWIVALLDAWVLDASRHFWLALLVGVLAYLPTSTMLYAQLCIVCHLIRRKVSTGAVYGILIISLLVAVSCALASHYALDYFFAWFTAPLGPPLELDTSGIG